MTTDDFTEAAHAEARRADGMDQWDRDCFLEGAGWARDHLAAQEPTDAEVLKAAQALAEAMEDIEEWDSLSAFQHAEYVHLARRALSAARAVGRGAR